MAAVLMVDDDADSRDAVARFLQKSGHSVGCAPNGREALGALSGSTPDIIILDQRMPELDGVTFLEVLRCYLRWERIPVILLTAYPDDIQVRRAMGLGVVQLFAKSDYGLSELAACVERWTRPVPNLAIGGSMPVDPAPPSDLS